MPRLFAESGRMIGQDFPVTGKVVIGRKRTCDVVIDDPKSSREHTSVYKEGGSYYVKDLDSSNGTCLNDVRVDKSPLVFGDKIRIGDTVLVFLGDPEQNLEGQTVGGFQVLEKMGHRDIGIVYRARQIALDREVALKVLDRDLSRDEEFVRRFIDEARAAGTLRHPNIIHVFDVGRENDQHFICMEYISGKTLRDTMRDEELALEDKVRIVKECASALAFAHSHGMVHKDVTPSNIILTQDKAVKIADMGIAKLADAPITSRDMSSLYYISPEECLAKPVGPQADIYSMGVVLYEMLTGEVPFKSRKAQDIIKEHITMPVPSPRELAPEVPELLAVICLQMTVIDTSIRYTSMDDVVRDLGQVELPGARGRVRRAPGRSRGEAPRPPAPRPVAREPVFVDDGRPADIKPRRRIKIVKPGLSTGAVGLLLFAVFLIILFFITSFMTKLMMMQFANRPAPEQLEKLIKELERDG